MNEADWLHYLGTLPADLAELARNIADRCASVIANEQQRHLVAEDGARNDYNNLRMIVEGQDARLKEIEREVGGASDRT